MFSILSCFRTPRSFADPIADLEKAPSPQPTLFNNAEIKTRMKEYCEKFCAPVSEEEMNRYIYQGEQLARLITKSENYDIQSDQIEFLAGQSISTQEAITSIMWLLMAKAAEYNEHHTNGGIRIDDPDQKLENFLKKCSRASNGLYTRISTHMKGERRNNSEQFGIELPKQSLPAQKHSVLFIPLTDKTLYIKLEHSGAPPIRGITSLFCNIHHAFSYVQTRFTHAAAMKETRKEHTPKEIQKEFQRTIQVLSPKTGICGKITHLFTKSVAERLVEKGCLLGLSEMDRILKEEDILKDTLLSEKQRTKKNYMLVIIEDHLRRVQNRSYQGKVRGNEAILPALSLIVN